nr:hypothetical protein CFP56_44976 [Quercus suber]
MNLAPHFTRVSAFLSLHALGDTRPWCLKPGHSPKAGKPNTQKLVKLPRLIRTVASEEHPSLRRVRRRHLLRRDPAAPTSTQNSTHFPILSRPVSSDPRRWVLRSSSRRGLRRIPRQISTQACK